MSNIKVDVWSLFVIFILKRPDDSAIYTTGEIYTIPNDFVTKVNINLIHYKLKNYNLINFIQRIPL